MIRNGIRIIIAAMKGDKLGEEYTLDSTNCFNKIKVSALDTKIKYYAVKKIAQYWNMSSNSFLQCKGLVQHNSQKKPTIDTKARLVVKC